MRKYEEVYTDKFFWEHFMLIVFSYVSGVYCLFTFGFILCRMESGWIESGEFLLKLVIGLYIFHHFYEKWCQKAKAIKEGCGAKMAAERANARKQLGSFLEALLEEPEEKVVDGLKAIGAITPENKLDQKIFLANMKAEKLHLLVALIIKFADKLSTNENTLLDSIILGIPEEYRGHHLNSDKFFDEIGEAVKKKSVLAYEKIKPRLTEAKKVNQEWFNEAVEGIDLKRVF
jgi:hypothetical protein